MFGSKKVLKMLQQLLINNEISICNNNIIILLGNIFIDSDDNIKYNFESLNIPNLINNLTKKELITININNLLSMINLFSGSTIEFKVIYEILI